jgi:hypothetical protein
MANETYADIILRFITDLKGIESATQAAAGLEKKLNSLGGASVGAKGFSALADKAIDLEKISSYATKAGVSVDGLVKRIQQFAFESKSSFSEATKEVLRLYQSMDKVNQLGGSYQTDFFKQFRTRDTGGKFTENNLINPKEVQEDWASIQAEFDRNLAAVQRKLGDAAKNPQMSFFDMLEQKPQTGTSANKQKILDIQGFKNQAEKDAWYKSYEENAASAEAAAAKATPVIEKYNQALAGGATGEKKSTTGIGNEVDSQKLKDYATKTGQAYEDVLNTLYKGGPGADKILNDMASSTSAVGDAAKNAAGQMGGVDNALKKTDETAKKAGRNIYALFGGFGSFFLSFAGKDITKFGTMLISPLQKLIAAASGSGVGAAWANSMKRVEDSFVRVGAIMANMLLPALKKAADLAERIATFAEAHPELVKAVVGLGGLSLAVGKLLSLAASAGMIGSALVTMGALKPSVQGGSLVLGEVFGGAAGQGVGTAIKQMFGAKVIGAEIGTTASTIIGTTAPAAGTAFGTAAGVAFKIGLAAALVVAFAAVEMKLLNAAQRKLGQKETTWDDMKQGDTWAGIGKTMKTIAMGMNPIMQGLGLLSVGLHAVGFDAAGAKVWALAKKISGLGDAALKTAEELTLSKEAVDAYAQYDKQRVEMEQQYEEQRTQIVADNGAARVELESKYESDRNKLIEDYNKQASQAYSQYQKSLKSLAADFARGNSEATVQYQQDLAKLTVDFHQSQVDAQKDHQKRLRKLAQEHADNVEHLTNTRDALGLAQENRDYKRKVAEENAEFRADSAKRKAEYKKQVAELQQKYAQDEAKRLEEYNRQKAELTANYQEQAAITAAALTAALADLDKKHKEEEKKLAETEKKQLAEMQSAHNKQEKELRQSLNDQLNTLGIWTGRMKDAYKKYYDDMEIQLKDWIKRMEGQIPSSSGAPGAGNPGGTTPGAGTSSPSPYGNMMPGPYSLAEKMGGRNAQGNIIGALSRAGNIVVNQMLRFSGELGASDKRQIQKIAHESAMNGVMTAIGA